ncbi:MAG TPA: hypothetical protein VMH78_07565 [Thermoplasmata archaeon]|nr:hypothetical protein [Thermoplasmata archaeon]
MRIEHPTCSWVGISPDGDREEPCGKPGAYYIESPTGHRTYSCLEHLGHVRAEAGPGSLVHRVPGHYPVEGHESMARMA